MSKQADSYCENLTKINSSTFYKVFKLLNRKQQKAIYAVYAFCRICDDIVDDQTTSNELKKLKLSRLRLDLHKAFSNQYEGSDLAMQALQAKCKQFNLNLKGFELLIDGQIQDLNKNRYQNLDELKNYCYLVASSVGLMINPILAPKNYSKLEPAAKIIGYSLQLTNILRDVGEDFAKYGRVYLPQEILNKYNLNSENLTKVTPQFKQIFEELAKLNEDWYELSKQYLKMYPLRSRIVIKLMLNKYRKIINYIRENDYDVFTKFRQYGDGIEQ
jgi:phytoene synthase